ncbi:MAG: MFS transporter [Paracoccaceae bacterium]
MRWRILALVFAARVGLGFQFQTVGSAGDGLTVAFGLDYAGLGLMIGLFMMPGLVLSLPAGLSGRLMSDRALAGLGLLALTAGGVLSATAQGPVMLGAGRVLAGVGFLFANLYFTKMVSDWFEGREIATAMSILVTSWPLGIAMGQIGHAWLAETFGWQVPFLAASAYCAAAAAWMLTLYRSPEGAKGPAPGAALRLTGRELALVLCAGTAWGVFNAGYVVFLSFGPMMLERHGATAVAAAGTISLGSWLMIGSSALCGYLADRFGRRDTILAVCMAGAIGALLLLTLPGGGLAGSVLFGLVAIAPAGIIMALSGQAVARERRAMGMGVFFTLYYICMFAVPPIAGAILDATGRPEAVLLLGMGLFLSVLPLSLAFRWIKARQPAGMAMGGA